MKIAIIGSRTFPKNLWEQFSFKLDNYISSLLGKESRITIISGGAKDGGDQFAIYMKDFWNIKDEQFKEYKPDYDKFKGREKLAPLDRNTTIAKEADLIIAIWDKKSRGTRDVIGKAYAMNKDTIILYF